MVKAAWVEDAIWQAEATVALDEPGPLMKRVFGHFAEHDASVEINAEGASARFFFGTASMRIAPGGVVMRAIASDEAGLAYIKGLIAGHLIEFTEGARPEFAWQGDGADATTFPNFREMRVERIADITPHMRRVTLSGLDLERFVTHGLHVKLMIPPEGLSSPKWPVPGKDGLPIWPPDAERPKVRTYTVRSVDPAAGTLDVDLVLHGDRSVGSRWAMRAKPGDIVGIRGPIGRPVAQADWYVLAGDETALPVIARMLEALPAEARGDAFIEVADAAEEQEIRLVSGIRLHWLHRNGAEAGTTSLLEDAVRSAAMPPPGTRIHALAGVEYGAFKAIRNYWRDELQIDKADMLAVAYWRKGLAEGERQ